MEVYHYTRADLWRSMSTQSEGDEMKGPNGWTFALLEPEPESWVSNPLFPDLWDTLMKKVGKIVFPGELVYTDQIVVLGVNVEVEDPNVFIADRALWEISERGLAIEIAQGRQIGEDAYHDSRVPIREYLGKEEELGYLLPEVMIGETIPLSRVKPFTRQPALERRAESAGERFGRLTQKLIAKETAKELELEIWYKDYCARKPEMGWRISDHFKLQGLRLLHALGLST